MPDILEEGKFLLPSTYDNQYNPILKNYTQDGLEKNYIGNLWANDNKGLLLSGHTVTINGEDYPDNQDISGFSENGQAGFVFYLDADPKYQAIMKNYFTLVDYNQHNITTDINKSIDPNDDTKLNWVRTINADFLQNKNSQKERTYEYSLAEYYRKLVQDTILTGNHKLCIDYPDEYKDILYKKDIEIIKTFLDINENIEGDTYTTPQISQNQKNTLLPKLYCYMNGGYSIKDFLVNGNNGQENTYTITLEKAKYNCQIIKSLILWSSKIHKYFIIWYSFARQEPLPFETNHPQGMTEENETLENKYKRYFADPEIFSAYFKAMAENSYNFMQSDYEGFGDYPGHNIIIGVTSELGLEINDILSLASYIENGGNGTLTYNAQKVYDIAQKRIAFFHEINNTYLTLLRRSKEVNLDEYLFIKEDNSYFHNMSKSYFNFKINENDFRDLDIDIKYEDIEHFNKEKNYKVGDYVFGEIKENEENADKYTIYRCLVPYIGNPEEDNGYIQDQIEKLKETGYIQNTEFSETIKRTIIIKTTDKEIKKQVEETQWYIVSKDLAKEFELISAEKLDFDPKSYCRFVLPQLEDERGYEYSEGLGEVIGDLNTGTLNIATNLNKNNLQNLIVLRQFKHRFVYQAELIAAAQERETTEGTPTTPIQLPAFYYMYDYNSEGRVGPPNDVLDPYYTEAPEKTIFYLDYIDKGNALAWGITEDYSFAEKQGLCTKDLSDLDDSEKEIYRNPLIGISTNILYNDSKKVILYIPKNNEDKELENLQLSLTTNVKIDSIKHNAFEDNQNLTKVVFGKDISRIGTESFYNCQNLTHVLFPVGLKVIGKNAFASCFSLTHVSIPPDVVQLQGTFIGCKNLKTAILSNKTIELGDNTFCNCVNLKRVYNLKNIKKIGSAVFRGCINLEKVVLPPSIEVLPDRLFEKCEKAEIIIQNNKIKELGAYCFDGCEKITKTINFDYLTEYKMGSYRNCINLKEISFKWKTNENHELPKDRIIPESFCEGCINLTTINFTQVLGVKNKETGEIENTIVGPTKIDNRAFYNCSSLGRVIIPDDVREMGAYAFYACYSLRLIEIPKDYKAAEGSKNIYNTLTNNWIDKVINPANRSNWIDDTVTEVRVKGGEY